MIKEYHVSENLWDGTVQNWGISTVTGEILNFSNRYAIYIPVEDNTSYTISRTIGASTYFYYGFTDTMPDVGVICSPYESISQSATIYTVANTNHKYLVFFFGGGMSTDIMLNEGTTALPYEPYGNTWNTKSYCKATTGSKTYSNFPIVVRSREQSISSWNMKGNEQHTGTASPTSPIEINGTGERTANLSPVGSFTITAHDTSRRVDIFSGTLETGNYVVALNQDNAITGSTRNTLQVTVGGTTYYNSSNANYHNQSGQQKMTFTVAETGNVDVKYWANDLNENCSYSNITFNAGSEVINEPYGYKIPISANGTALTPVYLTEQLMKINDYADSLASSGTVTYQIKKLVLTGNETGWTIESGTTYVLSIADQLPTSYENAICSHYVLADSYNNLLNTNNTFAVSRRPAFFIHDNTLTTVDALKTYLATQYANGTPVTVYYVIETAVTEQVTVSTIPTTSSPTTIDVNTSVKPSEMSLTYDGYKICKEQKYQNNAWT